MAGMIVALGIVAKPNITRNEAYIVVASGQVKCELVEQIDKTTKWVCKEEGHERD